LLGLDMLVNPIVGRSSTSIPNRMLSDVLDAIGQ